MPTIAIVGLISVAGDIPRHQSQINEFSLERGTGP
jgi:hypothetical protein